uniref:Uncharacterized protein n=1 Tax=Arundo donax TaxID=35708 RepID=A0A0A9HXJ8_ARUDO
MASAGAPGSDHTILRKHGWQEEKPEEWQLVRGLAEWNRMGKDQIEEEGAGGGVCRLCDWFGRGRPGRAARLGGDGGALGEEEAIMQQEQHVAARLDSTGAATVADSVWGSLPPSSLDITNSLLEEKERW